MKSDILSTTVFVNIDKYILLSLNSKLIYRGGKNFVIVSNPLNFAIFLGRPTFLLAL